MKQEHHQRNEINLIRMIKENSKTFDFRFDSRSRLISTYTYLVKSESVKKQLTSCLLAIM